jgi:hypothetical protein
MDVEGPTISLLAFGISMKITKILRIRHVILFDKKKEIPLGKRLQTGT